MTAMMENIQRAPTADIESVSNWQDDTVLLVLTYSKLHKYIPAIRQNLDLFWPDRPRTVIATDAPLEGDDVISETGDSFLAVLENALAKIEQELEGVRHVFLLLEDLCPLGPVDTSKLDLGQAYMRQHGFGQIAHCWPVNENVAFKYLPSDAHPDFEASDPRLMWMPTWALMHNCLVASVWKIDHLKDIVGQKRNMGQVDPWSFELPVQPVNVDHLMYWSAWPTVRDGFLRGGQLNPDVFSRWRIPSSPLLSQLSTEYFGHSRPELALVQHLGRRSVRRVMSIPRRVINFPRVVRKRFVTYSKKIDRKSPDA